MIEETLSSMLSLLGMGVVTRARGLGSVTLLIRGKWAQKIRRTTLGTM